jgi:hypothetical protein
MWIKTPETNNQIEQIADGDLRLIYEEVLPATDDVDERASSSDRRLSSRLKRTPNKNI